MRKENKILRHTGKVGPGTKTRDLGPQLDLRSGTWGLQNIQVGPGALTWGQSRLLVISSNFFSTTFPPSNYDWFIVQNIK